MNTRRDFLKALSSMAAGVYLAPSIEFDFPSPHPPIDWQAWNLIEYKWAPASGLQAFVNGRDVSGFKEIMTKVCSLVRIEKDQVRFSSFGNVQDHDEAGFRLSIPEVDGTQPIVVGMQYKETAGAGNALKNMALDDIYLGWDSPKGELVPNGEGLCIHALIPNGDYAAEWADAHEPPRAEDIKDVDEVAEHGSVLFTDSMERYTQEEVEEMRQGETFDPWHERGR